MERTERLLNFSPLPLKLKPELTLNLTLELLRLRSKLPNIETTLPPSQATHALTPGLHLDARHVLWLPEHRTLVAADLHLGYVWAHRQAGQLLPISAPEDTIDRLEALVSEYHPAQLILLGDIVHRALPIPAIRLQLDNLRTRLAATTIRWIAGNHDRNLEPLLPDILLETELTLAPHLLIHGDQATSAILACLDPNAWLIMGHEHPAINVHDRVTTSVKCPCFLVAPRILILPAFSPWSAGSNIRTTQFLSPLARETQFTAAYAVLANHLLPIPL